MSRTLCLLCLVLGLMAPLPARDTLVPPPTGTIEARHFDAERIAGLKADPALRYEADLRRVPTPWERFKEWLAAWFDRLLGSRAANLVFTDLLPIIAIAAIVLAIVVLSRGGLRHVFHGAPRPMGEVATAGEDIRGMDLQALVREAEEAGDLRRAIRLHYLLVLRRLVDRGVLRWSPEHTDRDYMAQIEDPGLRSRFAHLALVFQWVWYGHAEVGRDRYEPIRRPFLEFEQAPAR